MHRSCRQVQYARSALGLSDPEGGGSCRKGSFWSVLHDLLGENDRSNFGGFRRKRALESHHRDQLRLGTESQAGLNFE